MWGWGVIFMTMTTQIPPPPCCLIMRPPDYIRLDSIKTTNTLFIQDIIFSFYISSTDTKMTANYIGIIRGGTHLHLSSVSGTNKKYWCLVVRHGQLWFELILLLFNLSIGLAIWFVTVIVILHWTFIFAFHTCQTHSIVLKVHELISYWFCRFFVDTWSILYRKCVHTLGLSCYSYSRISTQGHEYTSFGLNSFSLFRTGTKDHECTCIWSETI